MSHLTPSIITLTSDDLSELDIPNESGRTKSQAPHTADTGGNFDISSSAEESETF